MKSGTPRPSNHGKEKKLESPRCSPKAAGSTISSARRSNSARRVSFMGVDAGSDVSNASTMPGNSTASSAQHSTGQPEKRLTQEERQYLRGHFQQVLRTNNPSQMELALEHALELGMKSTDPDFETVNSVLLKLSDPERHHPTREEIISQEPMRARWDEGQLRKARTVGALAGLSQSLDELLRNIGDGRDQSSPEQSPESRSGRRRMLSLVWNEIDYDGDGRLSRTEASEMIRECLSQKALSSILGRALFDEFLPKGQASIIEVLEVLGGARHTGLPGFPREKIQALIGPLSIRGVVEWLQGLGPAVFMGRMRLLLTLSVGMACLEMAANLHDRAAAFWARLDIDGNGEITKEEFVSAFPEAVITSVHEPARFRAEQIGWEAMLAGCLEEGTVELQRQRLREFRTKDPVDIFEEEEERNERFCFHDQRSCADDCYTQ